MRNAVVFLLRTSKDHEEEYLEQYDRFIRSYKKYYCENIGNNFFIILKGNDNERIKNKIKEETNIRINLFECDDKTFDIGAYFNFHCKYKNIFDSYIFFNSHSEINGNNWFDYLSSKIQSQEYDLVGSTVCLSSMKGPKNIKLNLQYIIWFLYLRFLGLRYYSFLQPIFFKLEKFNHIKFKSYPNPHIRTNAFCINSQFFDKFFSSVYYPTNKFHIHLLESSNLGLSQFVRSNGGRMSIVTINGSYINEDQWHCNPCFNADNNVQPLIIDNQIRNFYKKSRKKREFISFSIWGQL